RGAPYQRRAILQQAFRLRGQRLVCGIAHRDQHVSNETVAAGAFHRRLRKELAKRRIIEAGEIGKRGSLQRGTRCEPDISAGLREFVPGTDRKTIVTAIDAVSHCGAQLARNRSLMLDRGVGDASTGIEAVWRRKCIGWTDIEACAAIAAVVRAGAVGGKLERGKDRT